MSMKRKENVIPKEKRKRQVRNRMVYNDWGLYDFVQMLAYKCLHVGKELYSIAVCCVKSAAIKTLRGVLKGRLNS